MKVLGIRYCAVSPDARAIAKFLGEGLGMPQRDLGLDATAGFPGAVFPAGDSWVEVWPAGPGMPALTMLQVVVDDADAWASQARANGLNPQGPTDAHGERIYSLEGPGGFQITFQSSLPE
ncbi:MAG: hypothetical protein R3E65_08185 [Steroidobacteraceae bacterium]